MHDYNCTPATDAYAIGMYLIVCVSYERISFIGVHLIRRVSYRHASLTGVHLISVHLPRHASRRRLGRLSYEHIEC
jgi:hypothetical protein